MKPFEYVRADSPEVAVQLMERQPEAAYLAGGTNVVDHLKLGVRSPTLLVDVSRLPLDEISERHEAGMTTLRIGANVPNTDLAVDPRVRAHVPVLTRALLAGASGQIRNQATTGGNLLQRTRCVYFQDVTTPCNKREPGAGCSALEGYGRHNAILGTSTSCVAAHPSDLAVALSALDATVVVLGPTGERRIAIHDLYRAPGADPSLDTTLGRSDLILAVEVSTSGEARSSAYRKVRDRASYAFALVSVAAVLDLDGDRVRDVRIAWGGVAHGPWRARSAEDALIGRRLDEATIRAALQPELAGAVTTPQTDYKVPMVLNTTVATLLGLAGGER